MNTRGHRLPPAVGVVVALRAGSLTVSEQQPEIGGQTADALARIFTDQSTDPDLVFSDFFLWGKQYNNVPTSTDNPLSIAGYQNQFKALWGI